MNKKNQKQTFVFSTCGLNRNMYRFCNRIKICTHTHTQRIALPAKPINVTNRIKLLKMHSSVVNMINSFPYSTISHTNTYKFARVSYFVHTINAMQIGNYLQQTSTEDFHRQFFNKIDAVLSLNPSAATNFDTNVQS